jgi:hypothetical protein
LDRITTNSFVPGNYKECNEEKTEAGTEYLRKQIPGNQVVAEMGNIVSFEKLIQPSTVNAINLQPFLGRHLLAIPKTSIKLRLHNQLSIKKNLYKKF